MLNILRFPDFPIYFTGLLLTQGNQGIFKLLENLRETQGIFKYRKSKGNSGKF